MIVRGISSNTYFIVCSRLLSESEFLSAARVREGSPGAEFAGRMYCCLFNALTNISEEYERFYKIEYEDVWPYLERNYFAGVYRHLNWNYSIGANTVRCLREHHSPGMNVFYGDVHSGGDYVMGEYIISSEGFAMVRAILARAEKECK
ncbi:MAG: hypothetical protein HY914_06730 [Desulfomonile tiedjei]|nr:hypothetical protein [Desulfomonile tiedjei]